MSNRSKPWEQHDQYFPYLLSLSNIIIPMNQRGYEWGEDEVNQSIDDLLEILDEGKYKFNLGTFLTAEIDGNNYINDGQQRLITTFLKLCIIYNLPVKKGTKKQIIDVIAIDSCYFEDEELRRLHGENGKRMVQKKFSHQAVREYYAREYISLITQNKR